MNRRRDGLAIAASILVATSCTSDSRDSTKIQTEVAGCPTDNTGSTSVRQAQSPRRLRLRSDNDRASTGY